MRASITALHRRLSADGIRAYDTSLTPADAAFDADDDLHLGAQRVAAATVRALQLPDARMVVSFRPMEQAATVELAAGPEYFVEVNDRFRTHRRDLAAALSHEVAHVLLHRLDLRFPGTEENEILTDTAAAYLGAGWLLLDAYREDALTHQRFGYLTPEEFGYVLAKRAALFGEDPSPGSPALRRTRRTCAGARWPGASTAGPRWRRPGRWRGGGTRRRGARGPVRARRATRVTRVADPRTASNGAAPAPGCW